MKILSMLESKFLLHVFVSLLSKTTASANVKMSKCINKHPHPLKINKDQHLFRQGKSKKRKTLSNDQFAIDLHPIIFCVDLYQNTRK